VLSNVGTRYFKPVPGSGQTWLPTSVIGHQVFSTAGRITNIERKVTLTDIVINPQNFHALKEQALQSTFQMVRDTQKGLRYLIKDKESGQRQVEWETKKSQLFGVLGGFYDSSIGYPIPMLGTYLKYSSIFFFEYNKFFLAKTTGDEFVLPQNTLALGWRSRFTFNVKGFRLALWGGIACRLRWKPWGLPGSDYFNPNQRSFVRWRVVLDKDFFSITI
jgi:hypothetical protein